MAWILYVSNRQQEVTLCYTARIPDLFYSNFAFQFNLHVLFFWFESCENVIEYMQIYVREKRRLTNYIELDKYVIFISFIHTEKRYIF